MTYSVSVLAVKGDDVRHAVFSVKARNHDEAVAKATKVAHKAYPSADGWARHSVAVNPADNDTDPDSEFVVKATS